jgi:hypothetical protein
MDEHKKDAARYLRLDHIHIRQHMQLCFRLDTNHTKLKSSRVRYDPATGGPEAEFSHVCLKAV